MRLTNDEALREVLKRGRAIRNRKDRRSIQLLSCVTGVLAVVLICVIAALSSGGIGSVGTAYGSFLLSAEAGGYILTALIAFVIGVILTIAIYKYRSIERRKTEEIEDQQ